ncbi:MAG: helix-turn-helix domain-containing protein [Planctomycetota bacterium]|jgi:DNA-binding protein Fis
MKKQDFVDEQTGKSYEVVSEGTWDVAVAVLSILYLVVVLVTFTCLFFAIWRDYSIEIDDPKSPVFLLMTYAVVGGGLGGAINGIRSFIGWHAEREAFKRRYVWKYISQPLIGVALAATVYAFFRSGLVAFGGNFSPNQNFANQALAAFAIGAFSGYGSRSFLILLDRFFKRLFKIADTDTDTVGIKVPDLKGKTEKGLHEGNPTLKNIEKGAILDALHIAKGNREEAARLLEIGGRTLYRKMKEHGLTEGRKGLTKQSPPTAAGQ